MGNINSCKSICLFQSYWDGDLPLYIKYYLEKIAVYEENIIFITNTKRLNQEDDIFIKNICNEIFMVKDEGFDFGMWYKYLKNLNIDNFDRLTLINDSVILYKNLDDIYNFSHLSKFDLIGLTDSYSINYHLQAYFLIFNKKSIPHVKDYFIKTGIKTTYYDVVLNYEVGLTQYLLNKKLRALAVYNCNKDESMNPIYYNLSRLIENGFPFIKKKLILQRFGFRDYIVFFKNNFNLDPNHYVNLMIKYHNANGVLDKTYIQANIMNYKVFFWRCVILKIYNILSCKKI